MEQGRTWWETEERGLEESPFHSRRAQSEKMLSATDRGHEGTTHSYAQAGEKAFFQKRPEKSSSLTQEQ